MPAQMTVKELKAALQGMQLPALGTKPVLLARLLAAQPAAAGVFTHILVCYACEKRGDKQRS